MRILYITLLGVLLAELGWAQGRIRNVQLRTIDSARVEIRYDLLAVQPGDSIYVAIRSRQRGLPGSLQGNVEMRVPAGLARRIIWNVRSDGYTLRDEINATVQAVTFRPSVQEGQPTTVVQYSF